MSLARRHWPQSKRVDRRWSIPVTKVSHCGLAFRANRSYPCHRARGPDRARTPDQGLFRRYHRRRRRQPPDRATASSWCSSALGLRQVDAPAHDRRARGGDRRAGSRSAARDVTDLRAAAPRHRDGLPELRALPAHERPQEHRLRAEGAADAQGRGAASRRRGRRAARPGDAARPQAGAALGRPAPARGDGPRDRARAEGVPHGRAALEPRREAAGRDARARSRSCTRGSASRRSTSRTTRPRR